mgnify:CR=1 FL=1
MSLPGNKRRIVIAAFVIAGLFVLAQTSFALAPPSATQGLLEKPIPFNFAAGINFQNLTANVTNVGPELLAQYISELTYFFLRLAVVLAVLMITIGGFQWLIALGNASKISNAKDTIQQALIGLMLALTSYLMFSQIDKSFVELKSLDILGKSDSLTLKCDTYFTKATCDNPALHPGLTCGWSFDPFEVQVNQCSNNKEISCTVSTECGSGGICEKKACCSSGRPGFTTACFETVVKYPNLIRDPNNRVCKAVNYQLGVAANAARGLASKLLLKSVTNGGCGAVFLVLDTDGVLRDPSNKPSCELIKELSLRINAGASLRNGILNGYPSQCGGSGSGNNFTIQFDSDHCDSRINN